MLMPVSMDLYSVFKDWAFWADLIFGHVIFCCFLEGLGCLGCLGRGCDLFIPFPDLLFFVEPQEPDTPKYLVGLRRGILTMITLFVLITCASMHFASGLIWTWNALNSLKLFVIMYDLHRLTLYRHWGVRCSREIQYWQLNCPIKKCSCIHMHTLEYVVATLIWSYFMYAWIFNDIYMYVCMYVCMCVV